MKVILTQDVHKLGSLGDEVEVKPGYARNFLLPKGMAMAITRQNIKRIQNQREKLAQQRAGAIEQAKTLAEKLDELDLTFPMKVGEKGKLFGSVTLKQIHEEIEKQGVELDRKAINLASPLKMVGAHQVLVKLHSEVSTELKVKVIPDEEPKAEEATAEGAEGEENATAAEGQEEASDASAQEETEE